MNYEVSVSVYSVVTAPKITGREIHRDDDGNVSDAPFQSYLYNHTTVIDFYPGNVYNHFVLRTQAHGQCSDANQGAVDTADTAIYLAKYQVDRLGSGLYLGQVIGSQADAQNLAAGKSVSSVG